MADIDFHSSEMAGFYAHLLQTPHIFSFKENKGRDDRWLNCVNELHEAVQKDEVKNIHDFVQFVFDKQPGHNFDQNRQQAVSKELTDAFKQYDAYYQANALKIAAHAEKTTALKNDTVTGYRNELNGLCDFFGVDKNIKIDAILAPTANKRIDGQAWGQGFIQYTDFTEQRPESDYVDATPVLKSKLSTPLHEATHILFQKGGMESKISRAETPGIQKLHHVMGKYFEQNQDALLNKEMPREWNIVRAVDEALAASSSVMADAKFGKYGNNHDTPKVAEWYHGFEGANKLAPHAFQLMKEYVKNKKKVDDSFFGQLADRMATKENIKEKTSLHSQLQVQVQKNQRQSAILQKTAQNKRQK